MEEAIKETSENPAPDKVIEEILSRRIICERLNLFPGEISALKLAATARAAIDKFKNDYKLCSFYNHVEWRCLKRDFYHAMPQKPRSIDYHTLIAPHNIFQPLITQSMQENSENLTKHLFSILRLKPNIIEEEIDDILPSEMSITDSEIFDYATQHDLPVFVSIDGSLDENGIATVSVSIVAPDIEDTDPKDSLAWQDRLAKVLLIRS